MLEALKFICAVIGADLRSPNRAPECESDASGRSDQSISNCCEPAHPSVPPMVHGSEQNPQVPLASEDAFAQVPGNAETAVGKFIRRCRSWGAHDGETR